MLTSPEGTLCSTHGPQVKQPKQQMRVALSWRFRRVRALPGGLFGREFLARKMPRVVFFVEKMRILTQIFFLCKGTWGFSTAKDGDVIWSSRISWWNMVFHIREIMAGPVKPPNTEYDFPSSHWCRHLGNLWGIHKDYYFLILGIIWES